MPIRIFASDLVIPFFLMVIGYLLLTGSSAIAQTEMGQYPAGSFGQMKAAFLPPSGFVLENGTMFYSSRKFVAGDGNKSDLDMNIVVNRTMGIWVTNWNLFGADIAMAVSIPITNLAAPRPRPGDKTALGLGDIYLQPFTLGWHAKAFHFTFAYGLFAPTGRYAFERADNTGRGFWSHLLTIGGTYIQENTTRPWNATLQGRYEISATIKGTNIKPGQAFMLEYNAGKQISDRIDLGLVGYGVWQTTDISGSDFKGDPTRYRYLSIGPEGQFRVLQRPSWVLGISLRSYFDFGVRNSAQGNLTILSLAAVF